MFILVFNTEDTLLNKPQLRRALQLATDSEQMISRLRALNPSIRTVNGVFQDSGADQAAAIQPPWSMWSRQQRLDRAKWLLQREGYDQEKPLKLSIHLTQRPFNQLVVNALKDQWQPLGIDLQTVVNPSGEHYRTMLYGNFQLGLARRKAEFNDPLDWLGLLVDQSNNLPRWQSPEYQALVKAISTTLDGKQREAGIKRALQMIVDAAPLLPLFTADLAPVLVRDDVDSPSDKTHMQSRFMRREAQ